MSLSRTFEIAGGFEAKLRAPLAHVRLTLWKPFN